MAGDERAFERLIAEVTPALSRLCVRLLGWRVAAEEVEDVIQDVFVRVWSDRSKFRGDSTPHTWITVIALNVCRARIRRTALWRRVWRLVGRTTASEEADTDERWPAVVKALEKLPGPLREVIVLHYLEGHSVDQLATLLKVRKNTLEVRLHRARRQLQALVQEESETTNNADLALRRTATVI